MSISTTSPIVTSSAAVTLKAATNFTQLAIATTGGTLYLGPATVTTSEYFPLTTADTQPFRVTLFTGDTIAALGSSSMVVHLFIESPA